MPGSPIHQQRRCQPGYGRDQDRYHLLVRGEQPGPLRPASCKAARDDDVADKGQDQAHDSCALGQMPASFAEEVGHPRRCRTREASCVNQERQEILSKWLQVKSG